MNKEKVMIYCDGACTINRFGDHVGGWGCVIINGGIEEHSGGNSNTTNQQMELFACIKSLELISDKNCSIEVYSDSAYLVNCMNDKWYETWRANNWKTVQKKPVRNKDLWVRLLKLIKKRDIKFFKVDGHSGIEWNERADALAKNAMYKLSGNDRITLYK